MGLDVYLHKRAGKRINDNDDERIEKPSPTKPDHLFKIGYLRSSYNSGGVNTVLKNLIGMDLYDVFPHPNEKYNFYPNWDESRGILVNMIQMLEAKIKELDGVAVMELRTMDTPHNKHIHDPKSALEAFIAERDRYKPDKDGMFRWYSSAKGEFFLGKPIEVLAIMPNGNPSGFMPPAAFVIYKNVTSDNEDGYSWYLDALKITLEMIDYVLAQDDKDKYYLGWSG